MSGKELGVLGVLEQISGKAGVHNMYLNILLDLEKSPGRFPAKYKLVIRRAAADLNQYLFRKLHYCRKPPCGPDNVHIEETAQLKCPRIGISARISVPSNLPESKAVLPTRSIALLQGEETPSEYSSESKHETQRSYLVKDKNIQYEHTVGT